MNMIFVLFIICFGFSASFADSTIVYDYGRLAKKTNDVLPFDPALKPFIMVSHLVIHCTTE